MAMTMALRLGSVLELLSFGNSHGAQYFPKDQMRLHEPLLESGACSGLASVGEHVSGGSILHHEV